MSLKGVEISRYQAGSEALSSINIGEDFEITAVEQVELEACHLFKAVMFPAFSSPESHQISPSNVQLFEKHPMLNSSNTFQIESNHVISFCKSHLMHSRLCSSIFPSQFAKP